MQLVDTPSDQESAPRRRRATTRARASADAPATERAVAAAPKPRRTRKTEVTVAPETTPQPEAVATPLSTDTPAAPKRTRTRKAAPVVQADAVAQPEAAGTTVSASPVAAGEPAAAVAPKRTRTRRAQAVVQPEAGTVEPASVTAPSAASTEPATEAAPKRRRTRKADVVDTAAVAVTPEVASPGRVTAEAAAPEAAPKPRRTRAAALARAAEAAAAEVAAAEAVAAQAAAEAAAAEVAAAQAATAVEEWVPTVTRVRIVDGHEERVTVPAGSADGSRKRRRVRRGRGGRPAAAASGYAIPDGPTPVDPGPPADAPRVVTFGGVSLTAQTARSLADMAYENPTEIQSKTIPLLLDGRDVVGQAQTGTGKTAAFGIPLVERIDPSRLVVQALVLAPTRELASQISQELTRIGRWRGVHVAPIYGGASMGGQLRDLHQGAQVVVGTPGRILDHLKRGTLSFDSVSYLVLDEADRMLDMGFMPDVERILRRTPRSRQTALFSATIPTVVRIISKRHMRDAVTVQVKPEERTVSAVEQVFYEVAERDKPEALRVVLREQAPERAMVFCRTQIAVDRLTRILRRDGVTVEAIHGSLGQSQRERVIADFRSGAVSLLIATNLAARGLDIPEVSHVINYDIPEESESYVHRIGRTARMGREGMAITFVAEWDEKSLHEIKKVTNGALREERLSLYA